ncbi:MAG: hypothetical protein J7K65_01000 [Planctomycetes bacterium]|nr:hypothetical protein [Planctomycetota bacterium]
MSAMMSSSYMTTQEKFCDKLERVRDRTLAQEYRLRMVEQKRSGASRPMEQR